jgi:selenoprotein W-related protein
MTLEPPTPEKQMLSGVSKPRVEIHYCPKCRWLLRAAWMAQELLGTFESDLREVALVPAESGMYRVVVDGTVLFDRSVAGRFPDAAELKQLVRDRIDPARDLGHVDRSRTGAG